MPESVDICGEPMPLDNIMVREMLDREFTIMVWDRAQVFMWLKRAGRFFPHIEKDLAKANMPDDLKYLAVAESSLLTHVRSKRGALGTWQFMASTGRHKGLRKNRFMDERRSFEMSTGAALKYLKQLNGMFGSWTLALAAYNLGDTKLKKKIKEQNVKDYYRLELPLETERFVFRIAAIKIIMREPERYGYHLLPERIYKPIKCDMVRIRIRAPLRITDVAQAIGTDFKTIKELNPQILGRYLPVGRYTIRVPPGSGAGIPAVIKKLAGKGRHKIKKVPDNYYVVQPGDTLSLISKQTGVPVGTLKSLNNISGSLIKVGQELRIAP
ncbi:transglycosylase SLT domain-containing protein [Thermodesulfobacteriota bacterium]